MVMLRFSIVRMKHLPSWQTKNGGPPIERKAIQSDNKELKNSPYIWLNLEIR